MSERGIETPKVEGLPTVPETAAVKSTVSQLPASQLPVSQQSALQAQQVTAMGVLELREERALVEREQVSAGSVSVRRELKVRTETVVVELRREVMVIETRPGGPAVYFGEELLQPGESRELVLYDEQAVITKVPFVTEEVHIGKRSVTVSHQSSVDLNYEVLVVEQQAGVGEAGESV